MHGRIAWAIRPLTRPLTRSPLASPCHRVRHEAGEALGAIGTDACLQPLRDHEHDPVLEVAHTCQLALQRIEHFAAEAAAAEQGEQATGGAARYLSVDPTPPAPAGTPVAELRACLLDEGERIFQRYRAMFALRNEGGPDAVDALAACFASSRSALLKHEAAYVLGQMQDARAVGMLSRVLGDSNENPMVRHEAAEALGSIAQPECLELLREVSSTACPHRTLPAPPGR